MTNYELWIYDETLDYVLLDTDNLELTTTFCIEDISDISKRKDTISKSVKLKMTKTNNEAFGSCFHLNQVTDSSISYLLRFNFNKLKPVPCIVYENDTLLFKGSLRIVEIIPPNDKVDAYYEVAITGHLVDFKSSLGDLNLSDIDLSDLKHKLKYDVITDSWASKTERYNNTTNSFYTESFSLGSGYLYPHIQYGVQFQDRSESNAINRDENAFNMLNYRPALYLKELFNRIITNAGFTYEIQGDNDFKKKFNSAFIPNNEERFVSTFNGFNIQFQKPSVVVNNQSSAYLDRFYSNQYVTISQYTPPPPNSISPFILPYNGTNDILYTNRIFHSDAKVSLYISNLYNPYVQPAKFVVALVEAPIGENINLDNPEGFKSVSEKTFEIPGGSSFPDQQINLTIGERQWDSQKNLAVRIFFGCIIPIIPGGGLPIGVTYNVDGCILSFPKDANTQFSAEIKFDETDNPDIIIPRLPAGIKQFDFIKNIINLLNLYCYVDKLNPRHLIFTKYDDFWAFTSPEYITSTALDWTRKIVPPVKLKPKSDLPKKYFFTYKEDTDWLNEDYKKKYSETFGSFQATDSYGLIDSKKIELIFSPTPVVEYPGTKRKLPALFKYENGEKKQMKTNIRLLYYHGLKPCSPYFLKRDYFTGTEWTTLSFNEVSDYPSVSTYWYDSNNVPIEDLHFGRSKEIYFPDPTGDYAYAKTAYENYYINQVFELTNPNIEILESEIILNEIDINNLDLRIPVFIDLGAGGHGYFKILSIEYLGSDSKSRITALKVYNGLER